MNMTRTKRISRLTLLMALAIGPGSGVVAAESAPSHSATSVFAQIEPSFLPGFGEPSSDVTVINTAIGELDVSEPATLVVERLRIAPGDAVPETDGAQILQVEHGTLSYTDDLGLDAELGADTAGYFAAGSDTPIVNEQGVPAIVVRTTITGSAGVFEDADTNDEDVPTERDDTGDESDDSNPNTTGERPTPTEESGFTRNGALSLTRSSSSEMKAFAQATPEASPVAATPTAAETETATPTSEPTATTTPVPSTAKLGVLLEGEISDLPGADQQLFAADVELQPGAQLVITEITGPLGLIVRGGDLTVERDGRASSKLRNFNSVILPTGISATLINNGDASITLQIAGISGTQDAVGSVTDEPAATDDTPTADGAPVDVSGAGRFIPTASEMEQLGLIANPEGPTESTSTEDDVLWFTDGEPITDVLETNNWQSVTLADYTGDSTATDFGEVSFLIINVDAFSSEADATSFYDYVRDDVLLGQASHSRSIGNLDGVDAEMRDSRFNSETELETGIMVIRSGAYTVTIYTNGPDLDPIRMMEAVATLIFGARG
ncbi:hypothetical protein BH09CHL1_BH09CHL1_18930 [soil metagenome]